MRLRSYSRRKSPVPFQQPATNYRTHLCKSRTAWSAVIKDYFGPRIVKYLSISKPAPRNADVRGLDIQYVAQAFLQGKG